MTTSHGGAPWRWEACDADGTMRVVDVLPAVWWPLSPSEAADLAMARLMIRAHPDYRRLAGWRVRAWRDEDEGWALADDWLRIDAKRSPRREVRTAGPG